MDDGWITAHFFWGQVIRKLVNIYFWLFRIPSTSFYDIFREKSILKNIIFLSKKIENTGIFLKYIRLSFSCSLEYFWHFVIHLPHRNYYNYFSNICFPSDIWHKSIFFLLITSYSWFFFSAFFGVSIMPSLKNVSTGFQRSHLNVY